MNELNALKEECQKCRKCVIGGPRPDGLLANVFSNMNHEARIMVVGQNPGEDEVRKGEPFVGMSGKFFDRAVQEVLGLQRSQLYISNCVRCFTPGNRKPTQLESENCRYFLDREVALLKPLVIIALGGPAFTQLTGMNGIMKHHGEAIFSPRYKTFVVPVLHPSPLNTNDPSRREMFLSDLRSVKKVLDG